MSIPINQVLSHYGQAISKCTMSGEQFYDLLDKTIKQHQFPDVKTEKVSLKESGILSSNRIYFRVKFGNLVYDICAMQFGVDFCISSWLYETEGTVRQLLKFTKVGDFLKERAAKKTFYEADQESMFKFCVHNSLLETIDMMCEGQGLRKLAGSERLMS